MTTSTKNMVARPPPAGFVLDQVKSVRTTTPNTMGPRQMPSGCPSMPFAPPIMSPAPPPMPPMTVQPISLTHDPNLAAAWMNENFRAFLVNASKFHVKQELEVLEVALGIETENRYTVRDELGNKVFEVRERSDYCGRQCCATRDRVIIGTIVKEWAGIAKEYFTDADYFSVTFPPDLDPIVKALCLGAIFHMDFTYYESAAHRQYGNRY